jgi:molybdate transport system substrate-binding protein
LLCAIVAVLPGRLRADELQVFAAASLSEALEESGRAFESASGHELVFNLGASSDLARQIQAGAPADVFFSADTVQMDKLVEAGLVRASERVELLSNTLVVVVPRSATSAPASAADLLSLRRLALADPQAVPAGVYARTWLQSLGLWDKLAERVVPALNVRAALQAVELENAEAGVVYRTDARLSQNVRVAFEVPAAQGPRIAYALAPLIRASPGARDLVRHLRAAESARIFERLGFVVLAR